MPTASRRGLVDPTPSPAARQWGGVYGQEREIGGPTLVGGPGALVVGATVVGARPGRVVAVVAPGGDVGAGAGVRVGAVASGGGVDGGTVGLGGCPRGQ